MQYILKNVIKNQPESLVTYNTFWWEPSDGRFIPLEIILEATIALSSLHLQQIF